MTLSQPGLTFSARRDPGLSMAIRSSFRDLPQLAFRAHFNLATVDKDARTVELVWTTGARVLRGFYEPFLEELSLDPKHVRMGRLESGTAPLLNSHRSYDLRDVIGVIDSAKISKQGGTAVARFDKGAEGEEAFRKVCDGIVRNTSVGYTIHKLQLVEGGGDGGKETPVYRAIDWEPHEISLVPVGADAGAVTRSGGATSPCEFIHEERHMDPENINTNPAPAPAPAVQPAAVDQRAAVDAERARVLGIQRVARALKRPDDEAAAAIGAGTSLDAYRAAATDAYAEATQLPISNHQRIEAGEDNRDKMLRGAEAWIIQRSGQAAMVSQHLASQGQKFDADAGEFRGLRMIDLARMFLERSGVRTSGMLPQDLIGQALSMRSASGGAASTGDFPVLLENTMNKVLLASYGTTPDTWSRFCKKGSVSDFREHKRYRLGTLSRLSSLNELGEFANKSIPDANKESISAGTKGNIIGISRKALINDDLGAFSTLATAFGRAARLTIEAEVFDLLALGGGLGPVMSDGLTLYHASHNNITTAAALSVAALDADRVAMGYQKDPSQVELLDLRPSVLLLPLGLGGEARVINDAQYDPDTVNKLQRPNKVRGLFADIVDTARFAAGSTRRYLFADPSIAPAIEVVFLDGQETPFMDIQEGWRADGVEWKVRLDFGVGAIDWRGTVTNAGA